MSPPDPAAGSESAAADASGAFPPDDHVLRDIAIVSWLEAEGLGCADLGVTPAVLDTSGAVALGALVTLVDLACARAALLAVAPDWITTVDISVASGQRRALGTVHAAATVVRAGSRLIHLDVDLGPVGAAAASFVRLPAAVSSVGRMPVSVGERTTMTPSDHVLEVPVTERMGLTVGERTVDLEVSDYVTNSMGTVQGGVLGFVVSAAAQAATGWPATDVTLRYVGQATVGPVRATWRIVRRSADHAVVDVTVADAGAGDRVLVRALVTATAPTP